MREIVDLDSGSAATIFSFIKIPRDNPREELGMIELENSLSQAIWKMFDGIRVSVSERLGVDEADILLTDARVIGVKIDGNQIINPSGFTGRELEILLALTMVKRDKFFYDTLAEFINGVIIGIKSARNTKNDLPPIYLHTFFPIPEGLHRKRFSFGNKRMRFLPSAAGSDIEVFASDEVHNRYDELNQLARRRIKWLMPTA